MGASSGAQRTGSSHAHQASLDLKSAAPVLSATSWYVSGELQLDRWIQLGRQLGRVGRSVNWWIGDWLRYGAGRYGETYTQAAHVTGYDVHTLENIVYVAGRFDFARRREQLSWSHHSALASLEDAEQDHWLELAQLKHLSVHDLRTEIRGSRRLAGGPETERGRHRTPAPRAREKATLVCPQCQFIIAIDNFTMPDANE
jgi:hypothetical protein